MRSHTGNPNPLTYGWFEFPRKSFWGSQGPRQGSRLATLTSLAIWRYVDEVRYDQIQLHIIGFPHALARRRACFVFANCMSADQIIEKRGRRAEPSRAETQRTVAEFKSDALH